MQTAAEISHASALPLDDAAATAAAVNILQSLGWELGVFAVTVVVAAFCRHAGVMKPASCSAPSRPSRAISTGSTRSPTTRPEGFHVASKASSPPLRASGFDAVMSYCNSRENGSVYGAFTLYSRLRASPAAEMLHELKTSKHDAEQIFGALVLAAGRAGKTDVIEQFLSDMQRLDVPRNVTIYESAMRLLAAKQQHAAALRVSERMEQDGFELSLITLGCLVNFASEEGDNERAVKYFDRLATRGVPSIRAYMSVLRVLSKMKGWERSIDIYRDCQTRADSGADSVVLNIVLATCVAAGALKQAKALLDEVSASRPHCVDTVSFNTVLKGVAQRNAGDVALELLGRMEKLSIPRSGITYNTVIDANMRCSNNVAAWRVYGSMQSAGMKPDRFTCSTLGKGVKDSSAAQLGLLLDVLDMTARQCSTQLVNRMVDSIIEQAMSMTGAESDAATSVLSRARAFRI